jgi:iron complex transport system substrate-binding protein
VYQKRRIVSFLPSSTEILYEIGAGEDIVGVTHECDYPADSKRKPKVIKCSFDSAKINSKEIDRKIGELVHSGREIYQVVDNILKAARPDLIIAQGICEVCSPSTNEVNVAISILGYQPDILIIDPHDLDQILVSIVEVANRVGRINEGNELVVNLQKRIDAVRMMVSQQRSTGSKNGNGNHRQKVLCIEWIDPFFSAGHWIPQMVEIAGGINGLSYQGQPSRRMDIEEIIKFDPDKIILMPCGFDLSRTITEARTLENNKEWKSLRAVQSNEVYAVNAREYFSKPGPRTVTGLEILAKIIGAKQYFDQLKVPGNSFTKLKE